MSALLASFFLMGGIDVYKNVGSPAPGECWTYDLCTVKNPYGVLEAGFSGDLAKNVTVTFDYRHASSVATTKDHGINALELSLTWRPFK